MQTIKDYIWGIYNRLYQPPLSYETVYWTYTWPQNHDFFWGSCTYKGRIGRNKNTGCATWWPVNDGNVAAHRIANYWRGSCCDHSKNRCPSKEDACNDCARRAHPIINDKIAATQRAFGQKWIDPMNAGHIYWLY